MSRKTSSHILPGYAYAPETSSCIFAESKRDKKTRYCSIQVPLLHRVDNVQTSIFRCDIEVNIKPINDAPLDVDIISRIDGVAPATTSFKRVKEWCIAEYGNRENFVRNKQKILETILQGYGQSDVARWKSSETIRCQQNQTDDEKQIMVSRKKIDDKVKKSINIYSFNRSQKKPLIRHQFHIYYLSHKFHILRRYLFYVRTIKQ